MANLFKLHTGTDGTASYLNFIAVLYMKKKKLSKTFEFKEK